MHYANTFAIYMFHSCWWTLLFGSFPICLILWQQKNLQCIRQMMDLKRSWWIRDTWSEETITSEILKQGTFVLPVKGGTVIVQISLLIRAYHCLISSFPLAFLCHITSLGLPHSLKDKCNLIAVKKKKKVLFYCFL